MNNCLGRAICVVLGLLGGVCVLLAVSAAVGGSEPIAVLYVIAALAFFGLGTLLEILMRLLGKEASE